MTNQQLAHIVAQYILCKIAREDEFSELFNWPLAELTQRSGYTPEKGAYVERKKECIEILLNRSHQINNLVERLQACGVDVTQLPLIH